MTCLSRRLTSGWCIYAILEFVSSQWPNKHSLGCNPVSSSICESLHHQVTCWCLQMLPLRLIADCTTIIYMEVSWQLKKKIIFFICLTWFQSTKWTNIKGACLKQKQVHVFELITEKQRTTYMENNDITSRGGGGHLVLKSVSMRVLKNQEKG